MAHLPGKAATSPDAYIEASQGDGSIGSPYRLTRNIASIAAGASADIGAVADAAVITDTTGSLSGKLRGLVKWAFERMPAALGQGTMAQSFRVVVASDQSSVPMKDVGAFSAPANASVTTTQAMLAAANANRKGLWVENVDAADTVYWGITSAVTASNGMPIYPLERVFIPTTTALHLIGSAAADVRWSEMT